MSVWSERPSAPCSVILDSEEEAWCGPHICSPHASCKHPSFLLEINLIANSASSSQSENLQSLRNTVQPWHLPNGIVFVNFIPFAYVITWDTVLECVTFHILLAEFIFMIFVLTA